jgi:hypothetical protein
MSGMYRKREAHQRRQPLSQAALGREDQAVSYPSCRTGTQQQVTPPISTATRKERWIQNKAPETRCATRPDSKAFGRTAPHRNAETGDPVPAS